MIEIMYLIYLEFIQCLHAPELVEKAMQYRWMGGNTG